MKLRRRELGKLMHCSLMMQSGSRSIVEENHATRQLVEDEDKLMRVVAACDASVSKIFTQIQCSGVLV